MDRRRKRVGLNATQAQSASSRDEQVLPQEAAQAPAGRARNKSRCWRCCAGPRARRWPRSWMPPDGSRTRSAASSPRWSARSWVSTWCPRSPQASGCTGSVLGLSASGPEAMKAQLVLPPLRDGAADRQVMDLPIAAEIARVRLLSLGDLRTAWRKMFSRSPPAALTRDLLARMIAWRMQEKAFGGHDPESLKLLARLARGERAGEPRRNLKSGTVLVREYRGERHSVTVVAAGFVWREETYASLSTIARAITGTAWNGPRFFGLRAAPDPTGSQPSTAAQARLASKARHESQAAAGEAQP